METMKEHWLRAIGTPEHYDFSHSMCLVRKYDHPEFDGELYLQSNGPETFQQLLMVFPKHLTEPVPAVVVPFYYPEAMLGFSPDTGERLPRFENIEMLLHLVRRGYAAASATSYHLTYLPKSTRERDDFLRWHDAAEALNREHPEWTGIGKLTADTFLLTDALAGDARVDASRLGIAGHSLGGKMAFYSGCLDPRIRVMLCSDFGIGWEQTNWKDIWYWGSKLEALKAAGLDHSQLLGISGGKPFCLLAGQYDNEESGEMMRRAAGYEVGSDRLKLINHATGHRPPLDVLEQGYRFLDKWLK